METAIATPALVPADLTLIPTSENSLPGPLLNELRNYIEIRKGALLSEEGWIHLLTKHARQGSRDISLWDLQPGQYEQEQWLMLDRQGMVIKAVKKLLDDSGKDIQTSVMIDGIWRDLTAGAESLSGPAMAYDPGFGFYQKAVQLVRQGLEINKQTIYQDCWYIGERYAIVDQGKLYEAVFDPPTGELRSLKEWDVSASPMQLISSMEVSIEKRLPQPPPEVMDLFVAASQP